MKANCKYRTYSYRWPSKLASRRYLDNLSRTVLVSLALVSLCVAQKSDTESAAVKPLVLSRADRIRVIYVSDFDLDPANFKQDKGGVTGKGYLVPPPPTGLPRLRRKSQDRATEARNLVQLMSDTLVQELQNAGFAARRLSPTEIRPTAGLLVSGVFTQLDEGNQMRRALLGFNSGKSKMELYVTVTDAPHEGQRVYNISTEKSSGKRPGAVITLNPYVGAAKFAVKFAMTKNAPEKMVKKTASKIAAELTKQFNNDPPTANN